MITCRTLFRTVLCVLAITTTLAACSPDPGPEKPASPPPVKDTVFGDMAGAVDKARSVEATTMQQKQEMDRAVQEAEGR
jgi:hypothetical protein